MGSAGLQWGGRVLLSLGLLFLLHAALAAMQFRNLAKVAAPGAALPLDVRLAHGARPFPARRRSRKPLHAPLTLSLPAPLIFYAARQVYAELVLSLALTLAGTLALAEGFKPIFSTDEAPLNSFHRLFGPRPDTAKLA